MGQQDARALRDAVRGLVRRFSISERADVACCGMSVAQAATLQTLAATGPLRLGALGRRLGIAPSTLTRNLERLLSGGWVERRVDGSDARAFEVGLTEAGRRLGVQLEKQEQAFSEEVLKRLPPGRRKAVVLALQELLGAVREATERCCPGAFEHLMSDFPVPGGATKNARCEDERCE